MKKESEKRVMTISIKLTQDEFRRIEASAEIEFDFPSSWIRKKILKAIEDEDEKRQEKI